MTNLVGDASVLSALSEAQQHAAAATKVSLLFVPRQCTNMRWQPSAKKRQKKWSHNHKMEENSTKNSDNAI